MVRKFLKKKTLITKMKNKTLLSKAKENIAHKLQAGAILLVVALMIFNTNVTNFVSAANNDTTTMSLEITGGVLEILNAETTMAFNTIAAGSTGTVNGITGNVVLKDYRSSPAQFGFYANSGIMTGGTDSNYTIPAYNTTVFPSTATIYNIATFNNTAAGFNSQPDNTLNGNILMFNSAHNAVGVVGINALQFNMTVSDELTAQTYTGTLFLTVLAI